MILIILLITLTISTPSFATSWCYDDAQFTVKEAMIM